MNTPVEGTHLTCLWHVHDFGYGPLSGFDGGGRVVTIEPWTMKVAGWLGGAGGLYVSIEGTVVKRDGTLSRQQRTLAYGQHADGEYPALRNTRDLPLWARARYAEALERIAGVKP